LHFGIIFIAQQVVIIRELVNTCQLAWRYRMPRTYNPMQQTTFRQRLRTRFFLQAFDTESQSS